MATKNNKSSQSSQFIPTHSKLHDKIATLLNLRTLGFRSEVQIDRVYVDECNQSLKIALEINGDYVHANPSFYDARDKIALGAYTFLAQDRWLRDQRKREFLESQGYTVFVVWESDNLMEVSSRLLQLIYKKQQEKVSHRKSITTICPPGDAVRSEKELAQWKLEWERTRRDLRKKLYPRTSVPSPSSTL